MDSRTALTVVGLLLGGATTLSAQRRPELLIGSGFQNRVEKAVDLGLHMMAALDFGRASGRTIRPRLDAMFVHTSRARNIYALANVVYTPWKRVSAPYLVAGAGAYFDNGVSPLAAAGLGLDMTSRHLPFSMEARVESEGSLLVTAVVRP